MYIQCIHDNSTNRRCAIWFIGDVHGRVNDYFQLIEKLNMDCSVQVGDTAMGFSNVNWPKQWDMQHRFIRGNHCNPNACREHPNYLGDFGYLPMQDMYYISGAWSIDYKTRIMGQSIWPDEELSYEDFDKIFQEIKETRPRIIVSHDCPDCIRGQLFGFDRFFPTKTGKALDQVFEIHQPTWWIFGHYHRGKQAIIKGTHFVCLQELECCEIPDIKWAH